MMNRTNGNNVIESDLRSSVCTGTIDAPIGKERLQQTFLIISHQIDELANFCSYHLVFDQQQLKYVEK